MLNNRLTPSQAWDKIKYYCAYQERSHQEVKDKLYKFGLRSSDVDELLSRLIEENYLNEERFARMFVGGKFRMKHWGRIKIESELKMKRISPYNIRIAMKEIEDEAYQAILEKLTEAKWISLKGEQYIVRQVKTLRYMAQKGYETNLVSAFIQKLRGNA
ncbi:MAG: RecX family transcriptional regulator [Pseudopedobacter saltans]|uniref:Regulatory protein RecX n=1 Tax=Pseudopedobacter saltans TaxID=151895 RepID=A0A2W5F960_9SPHI|nr:MAG: RecX family transcriptional regulator [Pseudopedobacter saltans]